MNESVERFELMLNQQRSWYFDAEELEQLFDHYQEKGNMVNAELALSKGLEQAPNHAGFLLRKAQLMMGSGEIRQAEDLLERALNLDPQMVELHLTRASLYDYRNQPNRALQHLRKAEALADPELFPVVQMAYGMVLQNAGRYRSALDHLIRCLGHEQADQEHLLYDICYCFNQLEHFEEGIVFFEARVDEQPFNDTAWYNLGVMYNQAGFFEKALNAYEYALLIQPKHTMAHFNRANTYLNLEQFGEALAQMQEAVRLEPDYPTFIHGLGVCYEKTGDYTTALGHYEEAARLDPAMSDAWFGQAACKSHLQQWPAALSLINHALELAEDQEEYWYEKARILMSLGRYEEAKGNLVKSLELDESFWEARVLLISLHLAEDQFEQALQCIEDGQEPHKEEAAYFFELAGLLYAFEIPELLELGKTCLRWALSIDASEAGHLLSFWPQAAQNPEVARLLRDGGATV